MSSESSSKLAHARSQLLGRCGYAPGLAHQGGLLWHFWTGCYKEREHPHDIQIGMRTGPAGREQAGAFVVGEDAHTAPRLFELGHPLLQHIDELPLDRPLQITVEHFRKRNSLSQKALYFMWMTEIGDDTGHSKNEMHHFFKREFLPPKVIELNGHVSEQPPSIADLTTVQMSEYMERIQAFAGTELALMLTSPGQWAA